MISQSGSKVTEFQSQGCFWQLQSSETEAVCLLGVTLLQYHQDAWAFSLSPGCPFLWQHQPWSLLAALLTSVATASCLSSIYLSCRSSPLEATVSFIWFQKYLCEVFFVKPVYSSVYLWKSSIFYLKTIHLVAGLQSTCYCVVVCLCYLVNICTVLGGVVVSSLPAHQECISKDVSRNTTAGCEI